MVSGCGSREKRGPAVAGTAAGGGPGKLRMEAYVWQRQWSEGVERAVRDCGDDFGQICYLAAEREGAEGGRNGWRWVKPDFKSIPRGALKVAAALRVGVTATRLELEAEDILKAAARVVREAAEGGVGLAELHLDLDCPSSRLGEYAALMGRLAATPGPLRWVVTVLPDWLGHPDFVRLVQAAGRYVLQVHALQLPGPDKDSVPVCDPARARRWVAEASAVGVPFRVALPTYASRVFFDAAGKILDVAGEDGAGQGPAGSVRMVLARSDAASLAGLIREWRGAVPAFCGGVIWYRLPVEGDRWNWSMDALRKVMAGNDPGASLRVKARRNDTGFYELEASVDGGVEVRLDGTVEVRGEGASKILAFDVHANWKGQLKDGLLQLHPTGGWLFPGRTQRIGWVRLSAAGEPFLNYKP